MRCLDCLFMATAMLVFGCANPEDRAAMAPAPHSASSRQSEAQAPRFLPGALPPGVNAPTSYNTGEPSPRVRGGAAPMAPEEYGPQLKAILTPIRQPMLTVHNEQDLTRLPADLDAAATAMSNAANALRALTPPLGAEMVHQSHLAWMDDTAGIYGSMATDIRTGVNSSHTDKGALLDSAYQHFTDSLRVALEAGGWDKDAFADDPPRLVKGAAPSTTG